MKKVYTLLIVMIWAVFLSACNKSDAKANESDFSFKKIAIITGSVYDKVIEDKFPNSSVIYCNSISEAILSLKSGKADAYLDDEPIIKKASAYGTNLKILSPPVSSNDYGVAVSKNNEILRKDLNEFISRIKADGTYDDMVKRWIDEENTPDMPIIEPNGEKGTLIFGTTGDVDGFTYYKDGELTGLEIELAKRFAEFKGMKLDILIMDFGALIPAVVSGKVDFAAAVMTIPKEDTETVGFSDAYLSPNGVICILDESSADATLSSSFFKNINKSFIQNLIVEDRWKMLISGLGVTMVVSLFSFILATLLGFLVCFLNMSKLKPLTAIGKLYVTILRGTPIVVLLMILYYVVFESVNINTIIIAIIAYGLSDGAYIGELFRSSILTVEKGQVEAARSMGFSKTEAFFTVTFPQAARAALPLYKSEFVALVKSTSVVGYIAIVDLTKFGDIIRSRTYDAFLPLFIVTLVYLAITGVIVLLFDKIDRITNKRLRRETQ